MRYYFNVFNFMKTESHPSFVIPSVEQEKLEGKTVELESFKGKIEKITQLIKDEIKAGDDQPSWAIRYYQSLLDNIDQTAKNEAVIQKKTVEEEIRDAYEEKNPVTVTRDEKHIPIESYENSPANRKGFSAFKQEIGALQGILKTEIEINGEEMPSWVAEHYIDLLEHVKKNALGTLFQEYPDALFAVKLIMTNKEKTLRIKIIDPHFKDGKTITNLLDIPISFSQEEARALCDTWKGYVDESLKYLSQ